MNEALLTPSPLFSVPETSSEIDETKDLTSIRAISLFAGCGGLDLGFTGGFTFRNEFYPQLPFKILQAYDNDPKCVETYTRNIGNHIVQADLSTMSAQDMPQAEVLIGGFPCQDFSSCGPKRGLTSQRGQLYKAFARYMEQHNPYLVIAENVPHLKRMHKGSVLETILHDLEAVGMGYRFTVWSLFAPDYGVPQSRSRLFLIGVRQDLPENPREPEQTHIWNHRSINWAIEDLEQIDNESVPNQSQYFLATRAKKGNGQGDEVSRYGEPSYTVRANAKSRVQFHYELPRRLTVRECARLQTFPDTFIFPHSATTNIMQIGNAVPPMLAYRVGLSIASYFQTFVGPSDLQDSYLATVGDVTPINT
jgi:DNA (cytosine-5)-methyltransferase 1